MTYMYHNPIFTYDFTAFSNFAGVDANHDNRLSAYEAWNGYERFIDSPYSNFAAAYFNLSLYLFAEEYLGYQWGPDFNGDWELNFGSELNYLAAGDGWSIDLSFNDFAVWGDPWSG